jgi:hypothetical protein
VGWGTGVNAADPLSSWADGAGSLLMRGGGVGTLSSSWYAQYCGYSSSAADPLREAAMGAADALMTQSDDDDVLDAYGGP